MFDDSFSESDDKTLQIAKEYLTRASKMWHLFSGNNENNIIMQFWTDIIKRMTELKSMKEEELRRWTESISELKTSPSRDLRYTSPLQAATASRKA